MKKDAVVVTKVGAKGGRDGVKGGRAKARTALKGFVEPGDPVMRMGMVEHANPKRPASQFRIVVKKNNKVDESKPLAAIHAIAQDMFDVGAISQRTMRKYDELCVPAVPEYSKADIVKIRKDVHVSQGVLAAYLNTSASTVQKWEAGTKKPSGAAAKLLQVLERHGLGVLE